MFAFFYQNHICQLVRICHLPNKSGIDQLVHPFGNHLLPLQSKASFLLFDRSTHRVHIELMHHHSQIDSQHVHR